MNMPRLRHHHLVYSALVIFVYVFFTLSSAYSQCTLAGASSWNATSGNWNVDTNWSPSGVPNSSGTNVCLTNGTAGTPASTVLNISVSIASLQLGSNNSLNINNGLVLDTFGTQIINAGAITLNGGAGANGILNIHTS